VEAARIAWRPLGRLLVEQGLLTDGELERALTRQQQTGKRLGETIVELGFVSSPELSNALAAQYGIELTTETGFGTGLRAQIQRRHEDDRGRIGQPILSVVEDEQPLAATVEPDAGEEPSTAEAQLLAQLEEQWAKLAAAEEALAERERRLVQISTERDGRRAQAERLAARVWHARAELGAQRERRRVALVRLIQRVRERDERIAQLQADTGEAERLRAELEGLRGELEARDRALRERDELLGRLQAEAGQREEVLERFEAEAGDATRLRAELEELRGELAARSNDVRDREEQLARLRAELEELAAELEVLSARRRAQAARLATRLRALRDRADTRDETESLRAEVERLTDDRHGCDAEIERLRRVGARRRAQAARFHARLLEQRRQRPDAGEADELRAAVERLAGDVRGCDAEIDRLRRDSARLRAQSQRFAERLLRERRVAAVTVAEPSAPPEGHVLFVQLSGGYRLVEREGPPPSRSEVVALPELDEMPLVVAGMRRSPLPGDDRPCVVAERP
jgi:DNA repair exonuclease SbcCD ATPase subunit